MVVIFVIIVLLVGATFITQLYRNAVDSTRIWVSNLVTMEAQQVNDLINLYLTMRHDSTLYTDDVNIEELYSIYTQNAILGRGGECMFFRRNGAGKYEILGPDSLGKKTLDYIVKPNLFSNADLGRAVLGTDYRGKEVLFAQSYLPGIDAWFIAKINIEQIRTPFYRASFLSSVVSILAIVIGLFLFYCAIKPIIMQLRIEEERFRQLFMNIKSGVVIFEAFEDGKDFIFKDMNRSAEKIESYVKKDMIGKKVSNALPGVEKVGLFEIFQRVYKTGKSEYHPISLYQDRRLKGWRENYIYRLPHNEIVAVYDDVTEQKKYELALQASNESLEELVYITSHDLQVPLISMVGYATELLDTYKDRLDEEGVYCLQRLKTNAERMHTLVLSLLDISRLNTKQYPEEEIDPAKIVKSIAKDLSLAMDEKGVTLKIEKMPSIRGDKLRMQRVFQNLITNSLNYGAKKITVGHKENFFYVRDDGIGIQEDQLEKIFRPGERLKKVKAEGVGMGLTFCKKVVERHNGKIWAESKGANQGATFYFTISGSENDEKA